jgi:hypothetical protein
MTGGTVQLGSGGSSNNGASGTTAAWIRTAYSAENPTGNLAANGTRPVVFNSATLDGVYSNIGTITYDGSYLYAYNASGANSGWMYFSRFNNSGGDGRQVEDSNGYVWSNGGLHGSFNWSTCPGQVSAPSATASSSTSGRIDLTWSAPTDDGNSSITGYTIYQGTTAVKTVSTVTSSYVDGLTTGTAYTFRISPINSVGTAAYSNASTSVTAPGVPSAPQSLTGSTATTGLTLGRVNLSWSAPAISGNGGTVTYRVYYTPSGGTRTLAPTTGTGIVATITGTTAVVSGLTAGSSYTFDVAGVNTYGQGVASNSVTAKASYAPSQVQSPTAAQTSNVGEVYLTWSAPSDTAGGIVNYYVYLSTSPDTVYATVPGSQTNYTATALTPGGFYGFFIRAANSAAVAAGSYGVASATVYSATLGIPNAPTGLDISAISQVAGALKLNWTPANGSIKTNIYLNTTPRTYIASVNSTSYTIYGLVPGTTYSYIVTATNVYSEGPASEPASASPLSTSVQSVNSVTVPNTTNSTIYNGTEYYISGVPTASTFTYSKIASGAQQLTSVPALAGPIVNKTNDNISATNVVISAPGGPTSTQFTYTRQITGTLGDIPDGTPASTTVNNVTNALFSGTKTVSNVDLGTGIISYSATGAADVASTTAAGTATNLSNTAYNGTYAISGVTDTEFSYLSAVSPTPADQETTSGYGRVTNLTNMYLYNDDSTSVTSVPGHNAVTYTGTPTVASLPSHLYTFSTATTDADPGSGAVRFNTSNASTTTLIYIDNVDNSSVDRTGWYASWDDLGATARGRIVITQGAKTWEYIVNSAVTASSGYYKIPVKYASGTGLPAASSAVTIAFIPAQSADVYAPYGELRKANSTARLDVRYRSGWLG